MKRWLRHTSTTIIIILASLCSRRCTIHRYCQRRAYTVPSLTHSMIQANKKLPKAPKSRISCRSCRRMEFKKGSSKRLASRICANMALNQNRGSTATSMQRSLHTNWINQPWIPQPIQKRRECTSPTHLTRKTNMMHITETTLKGNDL